MRFIAVLNRDGGTLRTTDLDALSARIAETLGDAGHTIKVETVAGKELCAALDEAARAKGVDAVMAGGGDGTISAAAERLVGTKKALAVLPAGTMNLFARSLGIPLGLDQAVTAFATAESRNVDVARANGRVFIHQFSIGMHAKLVAQRQRMVYQSRLGKIRASTRAAIDTILNPPNLRVELAIDGDVRSVRTNGIGISNNLFGEGHLPYADDPAGGVLGIYVSNARGRGEMVLFSMNMALGRWEANAHMEIHQGKTVTLRLNPTQRKRKCVIDGELAPLEPETRIETAPGALKVLVPAGDKPGGKSG